MADLISHLDHLVLAVTDVNRTVEFYSQFLGMKVVETKGRISLHFGNQKMNLHGPELNLRLRASRPFPGSADLCFIVNEPVATLAEKLGAQGVNIIEGPVERVGATGKITSIYLNDPDGNLVELSNRA